MLVQHAMIDDPVSLRPEASVRDLVGLLLSAEQEVAAVLGEGEALLGVVGLHDIMAGALPLSLTMTKNLRTLVHEGSFDERIGDILDRPVADFMATEVDGVRPSDPLMTAVVLFVAHRRRALPVRENGRFHGMVTRSSVFWRIHRSHEDQAPRS